MTDSIDDIFLVVLDRVHPLLNGNRKNALTQDFRFVRTLGQSLFERVTELQFNLTKICLPWTGRSTR